MTPVRIVHLGLGGFFRAHQAWYTGAAPDAESWGITAFTGRSRTLADALTAQHGRYTLIVRGPAQDDMTVQSADGAIGCGGGPFRRGPAPAANTMREILPPGALAAHHRQLISCRVPRGGVPLSRLSCRPGSAGRCPGQRR
ncbi:MAG: hypothetical protein ABW000_20820 [Actinoplanes sp.]